MNRMRPSLESDHVPLLDEQGQPQLGERVYIVSPQHGRENSIAQRAWAALKSMFTESTVKATATYLLATSAMLPEFTNSRLQGSSYLLSTAVIYFHPARTVGAMIEAMICCIVGLGLGFVIASGCTQVAIHYQEGEQNEVEAHAIALGVLFLTTLATAFTRAKYAVRRPAIATGCAMTHILTFVTITQISTEESLNHLQGNIYRTAIALSAGTLISFLGCCLIRPQTAASVLRSDIAKGFNTMRSFFEALSHTFSLDAESRLEAFVDSPAPGTPSASHDDVAIDLQSLTSKHDQLEKSLKDNQEMLLRLSKSRFEVNFEPTTSVFLHRHQFRSIFDSSERLCQHLGGLQASITEVDRIIAQQEDNEALVQFMTAMGKSLRQLVVTCKQSLAFLETIFSSPSRNARDADYVLPALENLFEKLGAALDEFDENQRRVLVHIYQNVHEDVFLLFFFVFELMEVGKELARLVVAVEELKREVLDRRRMGKMRWLFRSVWIHWKDKEVKKAPRQQLYDRPTKRSGKEGRRISRGFSMPAALTLDDDEDQSEKKPLALRIWTLFSSFKDFEAKFALKTALVVSLLSVPAFIDSTQPTFYDFRMHWALVSFVTVMTPSVGGTNAAGLWRLAGTFGGIAAAIISGMLFHDNAIGMLLMSAFFGFIGMYVFLETAYPRIGQIFLFTFNIILLNDFTGQVDPVSGKDYTIYEIALRRGFSVTIGILIGLFVSYYIWPFTARKALRIGLSNTIFDIGSLYSRLIGLFNSSALPSRTDLHEFLEEEFALRVSLAELRTFLQDAVHEPRLKGAFPKEQYGQMIDSCTRVLDRLVSMRFGLTKAGFTSIRASFIAPVQEKRQRMIGTILLYFYLISGALLLRFPLPPQLPDARGDREALINAIRTLPAVQPRVVAEVEDPAYIYYYAYVMGMDDVVRELENLGRVCCQLFGVMALGGPNADSEEAAKEWDTED
ncbi:Fusaric acid resistance protein-like-domain-containing protein [Fimicolochytrium jonesii]|uniref:Fusaric acid resistance protein-like-domain-containing protein n=1 Tax=Fimicolochytrium jonesii TaxID=1396493 RepID=UPI0022FDD9D0|nr:Fusaric acid resistance protein-like-domain-containing protein [Fimicolochytrium jonesii]KAI8818244.1 Fusaric acid resistance protein-like-domain-containing protein [Fimicolochytrium jonesii]